MRYFIKLSYNGTGFLGWQVQPQGQTVQGTIEGALSRLLRLPTSVTGAGRTDTGVNARMMIAHFDYPPIDKPSSTCFQPASSDKPSSTGFQPVSNDKPSSTGFQPVSPQPGSQQPGSQQPLTDLDRLVYSLNAMVGRNIAIDSIWSVADDAHARFDAKERTYRYYVTTRKDPFLYPLTWQAPPHLDFEAMNAAARYLIGRQDFTSFSKLHTQVKTNICDIRRARWVESADGLWYFEIAADRFLRNMVRAIVGTLVDVGRGKMPPSAIADIIARRDRCVAGTSMPPQALYLWDILY